MDGATAHTKALFGYAKAGKYLGSSFAQYRPSSASTPIAIGNKVADVQANFNVDPKLTKFSSYDNPLFTAWINGTLARFDYFVGSTDTYFLASMKAEQAPLAVQCGRTVTVSRPTSATAMTALMTAWPASIVRKSARGADEAHLPGAIPNPNWEMLLPSYAGVPLDIADEIIDDLMRLYSIEQAELSGYGWRCLIKQRPPLNGSTIYHYARVIEALGKSVSLRQTATIATKAAAGYAAGVTTINLTGTTALAAGDTFTTGVIHTITAPVTPVAGVLTGVAFTPATTLAIANGATVNISRATDYPVKAIIGSYEAKLIDGSVITVKDLRVMMQPTTTAGAALPTPVTGSDKIVIDGQARTVGVVAPHYAGSTVAIFECQAKG